MSGFQKHSIFRLHGRCTWRAAMMGGLTWIMASTAQAQIFGENGIFDRKSDEPSQPTQSQIGIPKPVTGRVHVVKGVETTFEISAQTTSKNASVDFLIRTFPSAGKIVSITSHPHARNRAIVTYLADPDSSADTDVFGFAARYKGGRYSSEVRFDIDLQTTSAEIQVEKEVDFGSVMVGESVERSIQVKNIGDRAFESQVLLSPPWLLIEPRDGKLVVRPREVKSIKVSFRPQLIGDTSYFLSLSRSKSGTTKLMGTGSDPFEIVTQELKLNYDPDSRIRSGDLILSNAGERPLTVKANGSARLQRGLQKEYILVPGGETRVPVRLEASDTAPFDGVVQFRLDNGYVKTAQVVAAVVPGRLELKIPNTVSTEVINFGKVEAGRSMERGMVLSNRGGAPVPIQIHVPQPFRLMNDPGRELPPMASVNLAVAVTPGAGQKGLLDVDMSIQGNDQQFPIRLLANVVAARNAAGVVEEVSATAADGSEAKSRRFRLSSGASEVVAKSDEPAVEAMPVAQVSEDSSSSSKPSLRPKRSKSQKSPKANRRRGAKSTARSKLSPEELEAGKSPLGFYTQSLVDYRFDESVGRPEDLTQFESKSKSVTIGWTAPKDSEYATFTVEFGGLQSAKGEIPVRVWVPISAKNVEFERIDRLVKAKIKGLLPASSYELRVLTQDERGNVSYPSEAMVAKTDLPMDWTYIYLTLGILGAIGLIFGLRKIYLDRKPEVYQSQYLDH